MTRIGNYTFNDCTQITFAGIPNSATAIGLGGFRNCTSLASASFGSGLTVIGAQAFRETALVSVSLPDSVTAVHQYVFYGCTSLTSVTFGANVASIGNHAFDGCSVLTSFSFPSALTAIGEYTLKDCTSLASVTIPNGITAIGQYAMYGCTALTSVTIPASVTSIANSVFRGCTSLTSIYYDGLAWGITDIGTGAFSLGVSGTPVSCTVYSPLNCADQKLEAYKGSYTTFTYSSHGWYMLTFRSDDEDYGTVSVPKYAIRENEQITVDGNVIKHNGIAIVTASPSDPTEDHYYAFDSWSIQGTVTVTSDMTITAGFVRASVVRMPVLLQEYVDLDATPSYQGGE